MIVSRRATDSVFALKWTRSEQNWSFYSRKGAAAVGPFSNFNYDPWTRGKNYGEWLPEVARLSVCLSGYHVAPVDGASAWNPYGTGIKQLWLVECAGRSKWTGDKAAYQKIRFEAELDETFALRWSTRWSTYEPDGFQRATFDREAFREQVGLPADARLLVSNGIFTN